MHAEVLLASQFFYHQQMKAEEILISLVHIPHTALKERYSSSPTSAMQSESSDDLIDIPKTF